jgi:hypothetical protein
MTKSLFRTAFFCIALIGIIAVQSCRENFETDPSSGELQFSQDTVYLDTVFTEISSSTYQFTVYNSSDRDINIPNIRLERGQSSNFRLNVDGVPGKEFENVELLAEDSLFVFIENTTDTEGFDPQNNQFLYTDKILFDNGSNQQSVDLVTLIQDAKFLYPQRFQDGTTEKLSFGTNANGEEVFISGFFLDEIELNFNNDKPYVIYGYAAVPSGKTLNIQAGARVHFHDNSGILVAQNASLHVNGELSSDPELMENEVIFEGDRLEPGFSDTPGQWGTIWLTDGATDNQISHATIKNATIGLRVDNNDGSGQPSLEIDNTQIYNSSNVGLLARTGFIKGENLVINNSGQASLNLALGGNYEFNNSSFVNYWDDSFRDFPSVLIENVLQTPDNLFVADLAQAKFTNCIIYGNEDIELLFNQSEEAAFNYQFDNCLIRFNDFNGQFDGNPNYDFENPQNYSNSIFNEGPVFKAPFENNLLISNESAANALADPQNATSIDILGNPRGSNPDAGAYESLEFME